MKLLKAINEARGATLENLLGAWNEIRLGASGADQWTRLTPFGEFPVEVAHGNTTRTVMQIVDQESSDSMVASFNTLATKVANFFRGIPFYEGHPDDPNWAKANPGVRAAAVGRIKELQTRDDGLWGRVVWNNRGLTLLDPEAPEYSGQSPHWGMNPIDGRNDAFRPVVLWSSGLTNTPNISDNTIALNELGYGHHSPPEAGSSATDPENQQHDMKLTPENLKALGFGPDATPTPEEINTAIARVLSEKATANADKTTAETNLTTANSRITSLTTELTTLRGSGITTAINEAITAGRITEAEKPTWEGILKADFTNGSAALAKLGATTALNTGSKLPNLGDRHEGITPTGSIDAINSAVRAFAKDKNIDITTPAGWAKAFGECQVAKPEVFVPATN